MTEVKYPSQRLAYPFFITMVILFLLQILYGLTIALQQVDPYFLQGILNFNVNRATHLNLAVIWIVTGFAGALLFVGPLITQRDLVHAWMSKVLLVAIWAIVLLTAATLPLAQWGIAGWFLGQPWLQEGLEFLEAGRLSDIFILVGFVILAYLILRIFPGPRRWTELHWGLAIGLGGLGVMWIFGMFFVPTLDLQEYFRWFVVHYWVEGVWEILYLCLAAFLLYALFGAEPKVVGFVVFWGILLVWLAGLVGNGHHYFWIGTPSFWQFWGSLFSGLEPLPIIFGMWHVFVNARRTHKPLNNRPAFYFIFASALLETVGAGILGFTQTFSVTNVWEHGTWVTAAHAHGAFLGTFGMLLLGCAYVAIAAIKGIRRPADRLSRTAFWFAFVGILGMVLSFALGGTVQVYIYRILGLDWFGAYVRPALQLWRVLLFTCGLIFATGVVLMSYDLFTLREQGKEESSVSAPGVQGRGMWWRGPVSVSEMLGWLGVLWLAGLLVTGGLLSYNLPSVALGDPTLPYVLAGVGYPALVLATIAFALRFLRAFDGQQTAMGLNVVG